jgi:Uma2 family endonuclease
MDMWSGTDNSKPSIYSARKKGHVNMPMTSKEPEEPTPANHIPGPKQGEWTYSHYAALPDDGNRYEIIDGVLYMAPSPNEFHQETADLIATYLTMHVKFNHLGRVFSAPFDVELAENVMLQPDVLVVLKEYNERIKDHIVGAPDLVVEVASPRTWRYDRIKKYRDYAYSGVKEYWIVDPVQCSVEVLALKGSDYLSTGIFSGEQLVHSQLLPGFSVRAKQFFDYD